MFQFLGILILLAGITILIVKSLVIEEDQYVEGQDYNGNPVRQLRARKSPDWMINLNKKLSWVLMGIGIFVFLVPYLFFFANRGYNYLLVFPTGKASAVMEQGIKWRGFAKIDEWQKYIDVKVVDEGVEYDKNELEGIMRPVDLRFIDQVTAKGLVSTRFQLPEDATSFIKLAFKFRTMSNLVNNTIIPTVKEQLVQTAYMFAAQDYISGEAQQFRQTFDEQLKDGTFRVEKVVKNDTIFENIEIKGSQRRIREIKTTYSVNKLEDPKTKIPIRIPHELTENNIIVSQVIVDQIRLEDTFKKRLEKQRDESAKRQLEQQKIETAKAEQQRIVAQGERDKAAERVAQEKEQVKTLIAIETKLKEEKTNKELATIALQTEKINAEKVRVKADADAYEIKRKVSAGITPEVELQMKLDRDVKVAAEIAKLKLPEMMFMGSDSKGTPLESLIGGAMAKQLLETSVKE